MKKFLLVVAVAAVAFGAGFGVKHLKDQAGNPPVGGSPVKLNSVNTASLDTTFKPMGNPPVGG